MLIPCATPDSVMDFGVPLPGQGIGGSSIGILIQPTNSESSGAGILGVFLEVTSVPFLALLVQACFHGCGTAYPGRAGVPRTGNSPPYRQDPPKSPTHCGLGECGLASWTWWYRESHEGSLQPSSLRSGHSVLRPKAGRDTQFLKAWWPRTKLDFLLDFHPHHTGQSATLFWPVV